MISNVLQWGDKERDFLKLYRIDLMSICHGRTTANGPETVVSCDWDSGIEVPVGSRGTARQTLRTGKDYVRGELEETNNRSTVTNANHWPSSRCDSMPKAWRLGPLIVRCRTKGFKCRFSLMLERRQIQEIMHGTNKHSCPGGRQKGQ